MIDVNKLIQKLYENDRAEISSFELLLMINELSFGNYTKFDQYLNDWISGKAELDKQKIQQFQNSKPEKEQIKKIPSPWDDLFTN